MTFHHALRSFLQLGKLEQKWKTAPFEARKTSSSPPINPSTRLHRTKKNDGLQSHHPTHQSAATQQICQTFCQTVSGTKSVTSNATCLAKTNRQQLGRIFDVTQKSISFLSSS